MALNSNWYKDEETSKVWWLDTPGVIGELVFSFDKERRYNLFQDYPWKLTPEQKAIFDKEYPEWAEFFADRNGTEPPTT